MGPPFRTTLKIKHNKQQNRIEIIKYQLITKKIDRISTIRHRVTWLRSILGEGVFVRNTFWHGVVWVSFFSTKSYSDNDKKNQPDQHSTTSGSMVTECFKGKGHLYVMRQVVTGTFVIICAPSETKVVIWQASGLSLAMWMPFYSLYARWQKVLRQLVIGI